MTRIVPPAAEPSPTPTLADLGTTVVEELVPASARRPRRERGDRPLLEVRGLRTSFYTRDGAVLFDGQDLLKLKPDQMRRLRGDRVSMIFQQPQSSLNPVWDVGRQIAEVLELHRAMKRGPARQRALELLRMVGIPDPERRLKAYPHEMSGGMAQRVMIAMALALEPELLIADEPTTALDVTIQAQILDLMRGLQRETGTAIILITHDLGVVAELADDVAVMYAGQIVERAAVRDLFARPEHPYTVGLLGSIPRLDEKRERLPSIEGR